MHKTMRIMSRDGLGRAEFTALGTGVVVLTTDIQAITAATAEVSAQLAAIDQACSRFRPDSELEIANRHSGHPVTVGPLLAEAIAVALRAAELTGGDVDPTVGQAMEAIGYDRDFADIDPGRPVVVQMRPVRGWTGVRFNPKWGTLHVPAGIKLDLGSTAKALAADRAADRAGAVAGCGVLVSIGGDIATAGPAPAGGWQVKVADSHAAAPAAPGQLVTIFSGGLATSGTTVRRWEQGGQVMHHIVDPRAGQPAKEVWKTVSVAASNCVDANTASTASIVRGESAPAWLSTLGLSARLVRPDGSVTAVSGWPVEATVAA